MELETTIGEFCTFFGAGLADYIRTGIMYVGSFCPPSNLPK